MDEQLQLARAASAAASDPNASAAISSRSRRACGWCVYQRCSASCAVARRGRVGARLGERDGVARELALAFGIGVIEVRRDPVEDLDPAHDGRRRRCRAALLRAAAAHRAGTRRRSSTGRRRRARRRRATPCRALRRACSAAARNASRARSSLAVVRVRVPEREQHPSHSRVLRRQAPAQRGTACSYHRAASANAKRAAASSPARSAYSAALSLDAERRGLAEMAREVDAPARGGRRRTARAPRRLADATASGARAGSRRTPRCA